MNENMRERIRDAVMNTFREWRGQWNVTVHAPEEGEGEGEPEWSIRVHSRPVTRGTLPADLAEAYLRDPTDPEVRSRWEAALRPIYERALTPEAD